MVMSEADEQGVIYISRNMREVDAREIMAVRWGDDRDVFAEECFATAGPKYIAYLGDEPVAVIGVTMCFPGVGQAWMFATDRFSEIAIGMTRFCKQTIQLMLNEGGLHRLQAYSADYHTDSHEWLKLLGFSVESVMKEFGKDGSDYLCFALVKEK